MKPLLVRTSLSAVDNTFPFVHSSPIRYSLIRVSSSPCSFDHPMKLLRFLITLGLSFGIIYLFSNVKLGPIPPLGKFFHPGTGFWQNAKTEEWASSDEALSGLKDEVTVFMDSNAIAHVVAKNNHDLYFMQGYVTARDRLWQMEFTARVAAGRLSEVIGKKTLDVDRFFRRIGLMRAAKRSLEMFKDDKASWEAVTAYTEGVNAWINSLSYEDYPIEYKLLDYAPEPWQPVNCALMAKLMAFNLAGSDDDAEMTKVLNEFGRGVVEKLFPDFPEGIDPIFPGSPLTPKGGSQSLIELPSNGREANATSKSTVRLEKTPIEEEGGKLPLWGRGGRDGSNNWALSGTKTATGKPLLANDTHLGLWLPCTWYMIQLTSPDCNVMGATLPGAPSVIIGFNDSIAWGVTNAQRDVRDWYANADVTGPVIDTIRIRGSATYYDTVSYTSFGPIVYDSSFQYSFADSMRVGLAMKWVAHEPSNELAATLALNRAKNFDDYLAALEHFQCPGQNFVFASVSGDIAIKQQGKFPIVHGTASNGVVDAGNSHWLWQGWIPSDRNPLVLNPTRGFVGSANQHPTVRASNEFLMTIPPSGWLSEDTNTILAIQHKFPLDTGEGSYPYYYQGNFEFYRNRRINSVLASLEKAAVDDMRALQNDNYSLLAAELLPTVLRSLEMTSLSDSAKQLQELLTSWDYYYNADSKGALVFDIFYNYLRKLTLDEFMPVRAYPEVKDYNLIMLMKKDPSDGIFDISTTETKETAADLIAMAMELTLRDVSPLSSGEGLGVRPTWGDAREVRLKHASGGIPPFDVVLHIGGEEHCVNAMDSDHGPAWRMIVSLEDEMKAWAIYPGGQSGNPGSKRYDDYVDKWAKGELLSLLFITSGGKQDGLAKQTFRPAGR